MTSTGDPASELIHTAMFAVSNEAITSPPLPDETASGFYRRLFTTGFMHLIEQGLIELPSREELAERMSKGIPVFRENPR